MDLAWYSIETFPGQELKVKQLLEEMIEREQAQDYFGLIEANANEDLAKPAPSYVFVQMFLSEHTEHLIQSISGIAVNCELKNRRVAWYSAATFSGQELKVKQLLEAMIEREQVQNLFRLIEIPHIKEERLLTKKGKRTVKIERRNLMPSYVFIQMILNDRTRHLVQSIQGIIKFIAIGNKIKEIPEKEMAAVLPSVSGLVPIEEAPPVKEGDSIRIKEGPFKDYTGVAKEILKERSKLKAMVVIFGRSISVELNFSDVEVL
jgi:transcriptional antiterminator NusG